MSVTGTDTGVATYVGGDMYVGGKPSDANALNSGTGPIGTYAVEAEGLTVVNGSLAMNPQKEAWKLWNKGNAGGTSYVSRGFRWGVVGFGSQFRPADGKTVLAVGGNTGTFVMNNNKVGAWTAPGWLGKTSSSDDHGYKASLAGSPTKVGGKSDVDSVRGLSGSDTTTSQPPVLGIDSNLVAWNQGNLSNVNGTDYSAYKSKISKLSADLKTGTKLPATGIVTQGDAPSADDPYTIYKYDYRKNGNKGNSFTFYGGQLEHEKLITFTSTDTSKSMQVFNLLASYLNLGTEYTGIDFKFVNIPDNASVVINVTGAQNQTIDFHNGWRFWWNDNNIANDFVTAATGDTDYEEQKKKNNNYAKRAQQIMWNFADASQVIIRGGQATGKIQVSNHNDDKSTNHGAWGSTIDGEKGVSHDMQATDDPSAAWMGSILVPNGNLQSHVSTNGRVWVGGDFEMLNNETVKRVRGQSSDGHTEGEEFINESGEKTTSILDMDQERHNLPWNGQMTSNCPAIQWNKANSAGEALKGTTWNVYGTLEAAKAETSSLGTITDGEFTDGNDADGTIKFEGVAKSAKYFVKEFATNSTEYTKVNPYIYQINTGDDEDTHTNIVHVYDADGNEVSGSNADKKLTDSRAIINEKEGATLEWSKVDASDPTKVLSGSEWQLQKNNGSNEAYQITDSTKAVDKVTIQYNGNVVPTEGISLTYNVAVDLTAIVTGTDGGTDGVPQAVKWSSSDPAVASVNDGTVLGLKNGAATITACSVADSAKCATATITVTGAPADTKNTTTFYFKADGYASGNTKLRYRLLSAEGNEGWSTEGTDPVLSNVTNCSGWLSVTIGNPGLKAVEFLFYQGDSWYHSGSASSGSNFTLSAGQSAVAVQDYKAVNGAPSGCSAGGGSGSGGSTTTGTVTITGDSVVSLGKTITLTATPTPSSDTVTWYRGNTSVASVTAGSDNTATVNGLKAGTTTITAKTSSGATASITITVKDDSKVGVYFKKSAVNRGWSNYYLHYQKTANYWPAVKMEDACNSAYVVAYIPKADAHKGYGFLFRDSTDIKTGNWYGSNGWNTSGGNFTFWNDGVGMHIESNSDKGEGVPSGCQATQSAAKMKARVSTAVLRSDKIRTVAINESDGSNADASTTVYACGDAKGKCDMDTRAGYFKVIDLADGTYTLTETVAPNGYTAGGPYTVKIANGTVTITDASENAIAGNEIPNARNTGAISWNKVSSDSQNNKKLGGSEWKLTKTANFVWNTDGKAEYTGIAEDKQLSITITDCKLREGKTCSAPADGQTIYDVDPVEGQFKLEGLEWGTYTLVETKAPDGYDVDSTVRTFTFGPTADTDGTGTWKSNSVESKTGDTTGAFTTSDVEYDSSVFTFSVNGIKNKPGVILPGTGGAGDYWIYAAAIAAAMVAVVAACMALKVRRRQ